MVPVVARFGSFTLHTYTLLIDLGIASALAWLYLRAPRERAGRWLDAGIAATVGGFVGARVLYVIVNGDYYFLHLGEIVQIWQGGLAWPGAVFGALLGAWFYCNRKREPLTPILDALALPMAWLGLLSWAGCLMGGCAYGFELTPGQFPAWMALNAPDLYGLVVPRFPTQIVGLLWSLLTIGLVWGVPRNRRWPRVTNSAYALSLVALGAFFLDFTRGDPMPLLSGFRLDVIGSAIVLLLATLVWGWLALRVRAPSQTTEPIANP